MPKTSSFQVAISTAGSAGSGARSPIEKCAQPGAMIVAASGRAVEALSLMLTHGVESASVTGASEASVKIACSAVRPSMVFGSESVEVHCSPSLAASSPPWAKTQEIPLR